MGIQVRAGIRYGYGGGIVLPSDPDPGGGAKPQVGVVAGTKTQAAFQSREASYGLLKSAGSYNGFAGGVSFTGSMINSQTTWQVGARDDVDMWLSVRPDPTLNYTNGSQNAAIDAFVSAVPSTKRARLNIWMEIDGYIRGRNGVGTATVWGGGPTNTIAGQQSAVDQWKAMVKGIGARVKTTKPNIGIAINFTSYLFRAVVQSQPQSTAISWWDPSMEPYVDFVTFNIYNGENNVAEWNYRYLMDRFETVLKGPSGKPSAIMEVGSWDYAYATSLGKGPGPGDPQTKLDWYQGLYDYCDLLGGYETLHFWDATEIAHNAELTIFDNPPNIITGFAALNAYSKAPR